MVMVSDEPDQSPDPWDVYVSNYLSWNPKTVVSSVTLSDGGGYIHAATATGGPAFELLDGDWLTALGDQETFDLLVEEMSEPLVNVFELEGDPLEETLQVKVNGTRVDDWTYQSHTGLMVLDQEPPPLSTVEVRYLVKQDC